MSSEDKANDWLQKAEKRLKGFSLFSGNAKYEDAADYYTKAANLFKMAKKWEQAGAAFINAAELHLKMESKHEAATNYNNAANCFKKCNTQDAVNCLHLAVELYTDEGRFSMAAKHQKEIGELHEGEMEFEKAIEAYQTAADYFEGESATSQANTCLLKVAQFSAQLEKYEKAIEIFEQVAKSSLESPLLKWGVKEYFLKAGLCILATHDSTSLKSALQRFQDMDNTFPSQREYKFLQEIADASENYDVEAFTQAVVDFDTITTLDQWKTSILLKIKNNIKKEEGGGLGLA